jgi:DNA gyrase/topoisomerase IV subunit B
LNTAARELAFLNRNLEIVLIDDGKKNAALLFHYKVGWRVLSRF